ncbi:MAG: NADH-quinone oxidoreductase subunit M, partial [Tannerella sp.]|nr:NADH-quinone oxidoreductase subunit M [Tannerella sp.]
LFVGAFEVNDTFHRVLTVLAATSIVITAVYILRLTGTVLYGKIENREHLKLADATWDERLTLLCLIVAIAGLGLMPWGISGMIGDSVWPVIARLAGG